MYYAYHIGQLEILAKLTGALESCHLYDGNETEMDLLFLSCIRKLQSKGYQILIADSFRSTLWDIYIEFNLPRHIKLLPSLPNEFMYDKFSKNVRITKPINERKDMELRTILLEEAIEDLIVWSNSLPAADPKIKFHK